MKTQFTLLKLNRELILKTIESLNLEQLQTIPKGYNNHIAWNVAHLVVTQQLLHYKFSGLDCLVPDYLIDNFRKGTTPTYTFTQEEFNEVLELFKGLPNTLEEDYNSEIFSEYDTYTTSTSFVIGNIKDAIEFNNFHEALHLGVIMSLKKLV